MGTTEADLLTIKADKLMEGEEYYFRVVAENAIGVSEPCEMSQPVTAKLPFGKSELCYKTQDAFL